MTNITIITKIGTKPRPRFAKIGKFVRAYTPKTALTYERYIASEYQRLGGEYFGEEPLSIELEFKFKTPTGWPKYKQEQYTKVACDNPKDLDNLAKSVLDALNTIAYKDDRQIVRLLISKSYTQWQEGIKIKIYSCKELYPNDNELKGAYKKWQAKN